MNEEKIRAVLFDMDGVLLDTESVCLICWQRAAEEYNIKNIDQIFHQCVGRSRADTTKLLEKYLSGPEAAAAFRERTIVLFDVVEKERGLALMPHVKECLSCLKEKGYRLAVASSTRALKVHPQLKNAGIYDFFETITTGDMVSHSKPDPEIYLKAASSLNLRPEQCLAVEDSPNGVKSASSAGIKCIMVPDMIQPDEEIKKLAWKIIPSLKEISSLL